LTLKAEGQDQKEGQPEKRAVSEVNHDFQRLPVSVSRGIKCYFRKAGK
jgi:hypothetical protein